MEQTLSNFSSNISHLFQFRLSCRIRNCIAIILLYYAVDTQKSTFKTKYFSDNTELKNKCFVRIYILNFLLTFLICNKMCTNFDEYKMHGAKENKNVFWIECV